MPYFLIKGKFRDLSPQRFGVFSKAILEELKGSKPIWLHAVSVGEVMASVPLFEEIKRNYPGKKMVVSTVTRTGNRIALDKFKGRATVIYLPLDISIIVNKVVRIINPKAVLIAETEIWPNLITSLKSRGAKIILFNGRLSERSFKGYKSVRFILKNLLNKIDLFIMQGKADADKMISLGASADRVKVTGNLKYDAVFAVKQLTSERADLRKRFGLFGDERLLVAGSTHPGEEEVILRSYKRVAEKDDRPRLLIAPRHVERAQDVAALAKSYGLGSYLLSKVGGLESSLAQNEILILDVMGLLFEIYSAADLVFIGGSLINKGGQNPLEAAYHAKPVLFGPYMHNFADITDELLSAGAAVMVKDESELSNSVRNLLTDEPARIAMGERAKAVLSRNVGVAKNDFELIRPFLS